MIEALVIVRARQPMISRKDGEEMRDNGLYFEKIYFGAVERRR